MVEPVRASGPLFTRGCGQSPVKSFHHSAWQGLRTGLARTDTSNSANDIIFIEHLDLTAAARAIDVLVSRHPFVHGRAEDRNGAPWLIPARGAATGLETIDLRAVEPASRVDLGRRLIGDAIWRPFDVQTHPLSRFVILRIDDTLSAVAFVAHNLVCDGFSVGILTREFLSLYHAARGVSSATLPQGVGYGDYLQAIDRWIEGPEGGQARAMALARVADLPRFTFDRLEDAAPEWVSFETSWLALSQTARRLKTTPFAVMLAAHNLYLLRATDGARVASRIVTSGRDSASLLHTVGNLADRMYVIADLGRARTFLDILDATVRALASAQAHAIVRDEFLQLDLWEAGLPRDVPALNFIRQSGSPRSDRYPELIAPKPSEVVTRPRDCYYVVLQTDGVKISAYIRYAAGRIVGLGSRLSATLDACCQTPEESLVSLNRRIDEQEA
jgi:Condensation domain